MQKLSQNSSVVKMPDFTANLTRKRVKNINLRIDRQGNVSVSAPMKCSINYIQQFLQKKSAWITLHQTRLRNCLQTCSQGLQSGDEHLFLGKAYILIIHEHAEQTKVVLEGLKIHCYIQAAATLDKIRALLKIWQKHQMQAVLPELMQKWQAIIGVQANHWGIRAMKTRWGSCNTKQKRISLNLYLMQYPLICLEYVVMHELVHLLEASHNKRFYALMSKFMPDWLDAKNLLKSRQ
jgi:predicted metal-dependent hydrolase